MFYSKLNIYIKNNVIFDLNNMDIFQVDKKTIDILNDIYNENINDYMDDELYKLVKGTFFTNRIDIPIKYNNSKNNVFNDINNLQIKISNTCNLACKYCYANQGNYNKKDTLMTKETALNLCNTINNLFDNIEKVSFFGGEPLLNIDAIEIIVEKLKHKNILFSVVSNTTILNERILDILNKYNIKVISSLDGSKYLNDIHRVDKLGRGTFDIVSKNVDILKKRTNSFAMIESVYTKDSYEMLSKQDLYESIFEISKAKSIGIGEVISDDNDFKLPDIYWNEMYNNVDNEVDFTLNKIKNNQFFPINNVYQIVSIFAEKKPTELFCGAGLKSIFIDEQGDICPCQLFTEDKKHYMGNLFDAPDLLLDTMLNVKNKILECNIKNDISECEKCISHFWCFKCIGKNKDTENYGTQNNKGQCDYYRNLTFKTLNKFSQMINENTFINFMTSCELLMKSNI